MAEANRDPAGMAKALVCSGSFALYQGDYSAAQAAYLQSLAIRCPLDDQPNIAWTFENEKVTPPKEGLKTNLKK